MKRDEPTDFARLMASECLAARVRRLGRVITRVYDAALAPHGVTIAQLNLLTAIVAADGARPVIFYPRQATCRYPQVKGLTVMANSIYNGYRYEDIWLER